MNDGSIVGKEISGFLSRLAHESERAVVVMGAALVDESLTAVLVKLLRPIESKRDELFEPDRPLGSFGAKVQLSRRLGLVDDSFLSALEMIRKIRNDFAHTSDIASLNDQEHMHRTKQIASYAAQTVVWETLVEATSQFVSSRALIDFIASVAVMVTTLKYLEQNITLLQLSNQASFEWNVIGTDGIGGEPIKKS